MTLPPAFASMDRKRLVLAACSASLVLAVLILLLSLLPGRRDGGRRSGEGSLEATQRGGALAGELLFPGVNPYDPEFPLVRERKSRYTFEDVKSLLPDPSTIDVSALRKKRKERLETLYSAVD